MSAGPPGGRRRRVDLVALVALLGSLAVATVAVLALRSGAVAGSAAVAPAPQTAGSEVVAPASPPSGPATLPGAPATSSGPAPRGAPVEPPERVPADLASYQREREAEREAAPVRVLAGSVGLDAPLDPVGVAEDGQMEVPRDASRGGWYRYGPTPGAAGSAVLAGHVDDALGRRGAFAALAEADIGDELLVEHTDGTRTAYRIKTIETVAKEELAADRLFRRDGEPRLVLVTCTGPWSVTTGHYVENLVVTAVPSDP